MSTVNATGSFFVATAHSAMAAAAHQVSAPIPAGAMKLTTTGLDANNRIKSQRSDDNGVTWTDVTTYNSDQAATAITDTTANRQYRLAAVAMQAGKTVTYKLSKES